jgi:hypothetical protein
LAAPQLACRLSQLVLSRRYVLVLNLVLNSLLVLDLVLVLSLISVLNLRLLALGY